MRTLRKVLLIALVLATVGCEVISDLDKRSVVYIPLDNSDNCTEAVIDDSRDGGRNLGSVAKHDVDQVKASARLFEYQDQTYIFAHTPDAQVDAALSGDYKALPRGCDNWGYDVIRVRLYDGYETYLERVYLRPPEYWEYPEEWYGKQVAANDSTNGLRPDELPDEVLAELQDMITEDRKRAKQNQ